jgi:hypothetical protein
MALPDQHRTLENVAHIGQLWAQQLADYQTLLDLAQEEADALQAADFDRLSHTQAQRAHLAQSILERDQVWRTYDASLQVPPADILAEIRATIAAILALDRTNQQRLMAEQAAMTGVLQKLKEEKTALHQYKPWQEHPPQLLNRTV